jgi:hypothetical protein
MRIYKEKHTQQHRYRSVIEVFFLYLSSSDVRSSSEGIIQSWSASTAGRTGVVNRGVCGTSIGLSLQFVRKQKKTQERS